MVGFGTIKDIRALGFSGFVRIADYPAWRPTVPEGQGVYVVVSQAPSGPAFVENGSGGYFRGRDPNVAVPLLRDRWVSGTVLLYVGKAGGQGVKTGLRRRIGDYMRFGMGKAVGHWGGRLIWQLAGAGEFRIGWRATDDGPRTIERRLIAEFQARFEKRPFANLVA